MSASDIADINDEPVLSDKYRAILAAAAELFAEKGYNATSIRDIGNRVGLLGGSLYHHIKSKEALFLDIHSSATRHAIKKIEAATADISDPWARLERACAEQIEIQLSTDDVTRVLMEDFRAVPDDTRAKLVAQRDAFEQVFAGLVAALPLHEGIDRTLFRIFVLSILNNVAHWYKSGKRSPREIAQQIVLIMKKEAGGT